MLIAGTLPASITLRTIAPLVMEGTCLLIIFTAAVLLAVPFVSYRVNVPFEKSRKFKGNSSGNKVLDTPPTPNTPSLSPLPSAAEIHPAYPVPVIRSSEESTVNKYDSCTVPVFSEVCENLVSNFPKSYYGSGLVNYDSYRHKLIEETLRKQYGDGYAPGDVILNLIELNTADSLASLILAKKYDGNFFDEVKIADAILCAPSKKIDAGFDPTAVFPDPLTHFIPRNSRRPSTAEIDTETTVPSEISVALKPSAVSTARPNTPSSCQRIIPKRSREANYPLKSPYATPAHSQAPISQKSDSNASGRGEAVNYLPKNLVRAPPTEQLYKRNDTRPDVVSRTHVEAEEYLERIADKKRNGTSTMIQKPRIRSSLKKPRPRACEGKKFFNDDRETVRVDRTGDSDKIRKSFRNLSTSKPTIWNN